MLKKASLKPNVCSSSRRQETGQVSDLIEMIGSKSTGAAINSPTVLRCSTNDCDCPDSAGDAQTMAEKRIGSLLVLEAGDRLGS